MAALGQWNMLAGAVGRIVGGMAVVRGHGVPEVAPGRGEHAVGQLAGGVWGIGHRGTHFGFAMMGGMLERTWSAARASVGVQCRLIRGVLSGVEGGGRCGVQRESR